MRSESSSENFAAQRGAFGESKNNSFSSNSSVNANAKFEWKPDTMTNVLIRPSFNYSRNNTIYQYAMISAIYRFSIYGGQNTMGTDKERK